MGMFIFTTETKIPIEYAQDWGEFRLREDRFGAKVHVSAAGIALGLQGLVCSGVAWIILEQICSSVSSIDFFLESLI